MWSLPQSKDLIAVFRHQSGELTQVMGQEESRDNFVTPDQILSLWQAAGAMTGSALLTLRSASGVALAMRNGGLIVLGRRSLNIGLLRAASKQFLPESTSVAPVWSIATKDRFQKVFWEIVTRLDAAVLPRCFAFDIARVTGQISVENGALRFTGDFTTPAAFVAELRAASSINDDIRYKLVPPQDNAAAPSYSIADLLDQVVAPSQDDSMTFDPSGWPLTFPAGDDFSRIRTLSAIATGFAAYDREDAKLAILSDANLPLVTGTRDGDGNVMLRSNRPHAPATVR